MDKDQAQKHSRTEHRKTKKEIRTVFHDHQIYMEIVEDIFKMLLWLMGFDRNVVLAQGTAHPVLEFTYKTNVICIVLLSIHDFL